MLKVGVRVLGLRPEMVLAAMIAQQVYASFGSEGWYVITSCVEGTHSRASLHYTGCALDLRRPPVNAEKIAAALKEALGDDYDAILEVDHIHVEFQPKTPY